MEHVDPAIARSSPFQSEEKPPCSTIWMDTAQASSPN
jgi:hypothetical protein